MSTAITRSIFEKKLSAPTTVSTIEKKLSTMYDFKYNEINNKLYFKRKTDTNFNELKEYDLNSLLRELKASGEKKVMKKELAEILNSNFTKTFNPFVEYFTSLKPWDGSFDYIQQLADTITVEEEERENWNRWFKKWIVAVVASAIEDSVTNHQVLIFTGAQGIGKTTWMKNLAPKALSDYYYGGSINLGNKDTEIQLSENLFINLDELENLTKRNVAALKEVITKPSIKIRRPYGVAAENMARRATFMGSVNNLEFLIDTTGNRRYLCFEALAINKDHGINMDDVYAQAMSLYKQRFIYWIEYSETSAIERHNKKYVYVPLEQEILERYFKPNVGQEKPQFELETEDLLELLYKRSKIAQRLSANKLGSVLKGLNWPKRKTKGRRYWLLNEAS